jgi:hypothetical protein
MIYVMAGHIVIHPFRRISGDAEFFLSLQGGMGRYLAHHEIIKSQYGNISLEGILKTVFFKGGVALAYEIRKLHGKINPEKGFGFNGSYCGARQSHLISKTGVHERGKNKM